MTKHIKININKKLTGCDLTTEFSAAKQTLYHSVTPLATFDWPGTVMRQSMWWLIRLLICLCFFMPVAMTAVNPFLDRMPRELHEQYKTDFLTEFMKLAETNRTTDDSVITFKYALILAFARKSWKLQPSIGRCVHTRPISESRLVTIHHTIHANTAHKILHTLLAWKNEDYMHTPNNVLYHTWISICVYFCFK